MTSSDSTEMSASRDEAFQGANMAGRGLGFHSTFIGWIDRQEMGEVWGSGWARQGYNSGSRQGVHRSLNVPWACMKVARVVDRRTFPREIAAGRLSGYIDTSGSAQVVRRADSCLLSSPFPHTNTPQSFKVGS